jgi:hypothetical protein
MFTHNSSLAIVSKPSKYAAMETMPVAIASEK